MAFWGHLLGSVGCKRCRVHSGRRGEGSKHDESQIWRHGIVFSRERCQGFGAAFCETLLLCGTLESCGVQQGEGERWRMIRGRLWWSAVVLYTVVRYGLSRLATGRESSMGSQENGAAVCRLHDQERHACFDHTTLWSTEHILKFRLQTQFQSELIVQYSQADHTILHMLKEEAPSYNIYIWYYHHSDRNSVCSISVWSCDLVAPSEISDSLLGNEWSSLMRLCQ